MQPALVLVVNGKRVPVDQWQIYKDALTYTTVVDLKVNPVVLEPEVVDTAPYLGDVMRVWAKDKKD